MPSQKRCNIIYVYGSNIEKELMMKAKLTLNIESKGSEILISVTPFPKTLPEGPIKIAGDMIAGKLINVINEFHNDVKILNAQKSNAKVTDLEMVTGTLRILRYGDQLDMNFNVPVDIKEIENPKFKNYVTEIIQTVTEALNKLHEKNSEGNIQPRAISDRGLKQLAWAQRN